ncbi:MAG: SPOR domain-containing protein, partial [Rhodospirillales bacterium]|nr:SPOR domain-containing protein [Rhodospirillales bacterium]
AVLAREARRTAPIPLTPPATRASAQTAPLPAATRVSGGAVVQLAALESEEAAKTEWKRLERRYGSLLAGHEPSFSRTVHGGKTFWRVRTSGFADAAQAVLFCRRVKEKGGGCAVARF